MVSVFLVVILSVVVAYDSGPVDAQILKSTLLCNQCSKCDTTTCPGSEAYPHMTAWDNSLIAASLQHDSVELGDRGVYSVPNVVGGKGQGNAYYGWESTSGAASGYHRFINYMDKCSGGNYLTVDAHGIVSTRSLNSLTDLGQADWKSYNPPRGENHREFRFWYNRYTGKCLTVFGGDNKTKRALGVSECRLDGGNPYQLFAFRFHYHMAFCCCGKYNQ
ncbi:hypothetical protein ACHQM5_017849 [Ranunculus cassubicifolius]